MKTRSLIISIILPAILFLSGCASGTPAAEPQLTLTAQTAQVIVQGHVEPATSVDLAFSVSGRVHELLAAEGDFVEAGTLIATLDGKEARLAEFARAEQAVAAAAEALENLEEQAPIAEAEAEAAVADARQVVSTAEERLSELQDAADSTDVDLDQARAQLNLALAQQAAAEDHAASLRDGIDPDLYANLETALKVAEAALTSAQAAQTAIELRAPVDGTITGMKLQSGEFVTAGQPVATVANFSSWVVKTDDLTELEVVQIQPGQTVEVVLDALADMRMNGQVDYIASHFEEKRGDVTYTVTIVLDNLVENARWGMTGQVLFDVNP